MSSASASSHTYSSTVEQYIKCIFLLDQDHDKLVPMHSVAEEMHIASSTATAMMKQLERAGLISYTQRKGVQLTDSGRTLAIYMLRRHRLIETFLAEVLKYDWSEVHADAEQLEHAVSDTFVDKISAYMGHPVTDPHGSPIPAKDGHLAIDAHLPLVEADIGRTYRIQRIASDSAAVAKELDKNALHTGVRIRVVERNALLDVMTLELIDQQRTISIGLKLATCISLRA